MSGGTAFVRGEGGFTTPAAAVAILLVCALLFMCLDGYRVGTRSGQVQYVADAGALAADGAVADFVTAGQVVDAALLSLSLLGIGIYAASAVASFIPGGQEVTVQLVAAGRKVMTARAEFAKSALKGLDTAQKALPALAAVRAARVVEANARASGQDYVGIALCNPAKGVKIELADDSGVREAAEDIEQEEGEVQRTSQRHAEVQEELDAAKERAWRADCGPGKMSMCERAGHLAGLSGAQNPTYATSDSWSFAVPLARAKAYYRARHAQEPGEAAPGSPEEVGESIARERFYAYALQTVSRGRVPRSSSGGELPDLKELARNTEQIRGTALYTERAYPVSAKGTGKAESKGKGEAGAERRVLHAWTGCPGYDTGKAAGAGSVADIDSGDCERCETCRFSATTLGRVPSASTSIDNGFEYYYRAVVEASRDYRRSMRESDELRKKLDDSRESMAESISGALKSLKGQRYDPQPPGRYGCVCIVLARARQDEPLPFLSAGGETPARVAVSGATLAPDEASDAGTVISGVAEGLMPQGGVGSGIARTVLGAWGGVLKAYADGNDAAATALDAALSKIPLVGNDLSEWAVSSFRGAVSGAGLEPADLTTYKPVLVNTSQVMSRGGGAAAEALARLKSAGELYAAGASGDWAAIAESLPDCPDLSRPLSDEGLVVAELVWPGLGGAGGKVRIPAPDGLPGEYARVAGALRAFPGGG